MTPEIVLYRRSDALNELFGALAKSQAAYDSLEKTKTAKVKSQRTGGEYSYAYATLADTIEATKALHQNGLSVIQIPSFAGGTVSITTILGHDSGQWIEATISVAPAEATVQSVGSTITYLRRYSRQSIAGIAPDDDDAVAAGAIAPPRAVAPQARPPAPLPPSPPHDPATGEIGPYRVPLVDGQTLAWGQRLISHIKTAESVVELAIWNNLNREALDASKDTKAGASVLRAFEAKRAEFERIAAAPFERPDNVLTEADAERILQ